MNQGTNQVLLREPTRCYSRNQPSTTQGTKNKVPSIMQSLHGAKKEVMIRIRKDAGLTHTHTQNNTHTHAHTHTYTHTHAQED